MIEIILYIAAAVFFAIGLTIAYCLSNVAKDIERGIRVEGVKPFQSRTIENRLALGLLAQNTKSNKRK